MQDASLELHQGEIVAWLGPNGAGKTTFIKILATLLTKDGGRVGIPGYDLDRHPEEIRHLFGYVGQDTERSAYARLTVVENLRFFGRLRGMSRSQIDGQIDRLAAGVHSLSRPLTARHSLTPRMGYAIIAPRAEESHARSTRSPIA